MPRRCHEMVQGFRDGRTRGKGRIGGNKGYCTLGDLLGGAICISCRSPRNKAKGEARCDLTGVHSHGSPHAPQPKKASSSRDGPPPNSKESESIYEHGPLPGSCTRSSRNRTLHEPRSWSRSTMSASGPSSTERHERQYPGYGHAADQSGPHSLSGEFGTNSVEWEPRKLTWPTSWSSACPRSVPQVRKAPACSMEHPSVRSPESAET